MPRPTSAPTTVQRKRLQAAARAADRAAHHHDAAVEKLKQEVRAMYPEVSVRQLALATGRAKDTIQRWLKESP